MMAPDEWEHWREVWQEGRAEGPALAYPVERVRRARRSLALTRAAEAVLVVVAVGGLGAALLHAADAVEATLGALVAVAVVVAWTVHARARRREAAAAAVDDAKGYVAVLRRLRRTQRAFARFVWLVLALELVFLGRWWAGGISAHRSDLSAPIAIVSLWIPLTAIAGLLAWTVRLHRHAARELQQLDRLQDELGSQ